MNKNYRDVLDAAARLRVPENLNLYPRIEAKLGKKTFMQTLRARPALMILLVLLALGFLTGVAYAVGRSLGYIPGVGIVDEGNGIRVLSTPVSTVQNEITITVTQLVADATHTFISYKVAGIPPGPNGFPICTEPPALLLPDGRKLISLSGGGGGMGSESGLRMTFATSLIFPPIPAKAETVTFVPPCTLPAIVLRLVSAPGGFVTPAVEIGPTFQASSPKFAGTPSPTPTLQAAVSTPQPYPSSFPATPTRVPNGSGLYLDKVIEMEKSYILIGNFTDAGDLPGSLQISDAEYRPLIEDANGNPVDFNLRPDIQPDVRWGSVAYWAYEIPKPVNAPLKITFDSVSIGTTHTTQFKFDAGVNPQVGQKWQLNLPFKLGEYENVMDSVEMLKNGYLFSWHSGVDVPEGTDYSAAIAGILPSTTEGSSGIEDRRRKDRINYSQDFLVDGPVPGGLLTIELTLYETVRLSGPWTLTWSPPTNK